MHIPSLLVGSGLAGTVFLAVHQQLSHRSRLTKKWKLQEEAEEKVAQAWQQLQTARMGGEDKKQLQSEIPSLSTKDLSKKWNQGVGYVQDVLRRDD